MARQKKGYLAIITAHLLVQDFIIVCISFLGAFWIRFHTPVLSAPLGIPDIHEYLRALPVAALVFFFYGKFMGLYYEHWLHSRTRTAVMISKAVTATIFTLMCLSFLYRGFSYSRAVMIITLPIMTAAFVMQRWAMAKAAFWLRRERGEEKRVLILGTGKTSQRIHSYITRHKRLGFVCAGFLERPGAEKNHETDNVNTGPVLGRMDDLQSILQREDIDMVIVAVSGLGHKDIMKVILVCERVLVSVKIVPDTFEILSSFVDVEEFSGIPLLGIRKIPLDYLHNRLIKRLFDIFVSLGGLVFFSPLWLIIAVLIKLDSRGSVFYVQDRCGEDGKAFRFYKFRTMRPDAEAGTGPVWTAKEDPRRTRIGSLLRRFNIDEFPQLWNVLKGDMSLVGPRPERPHFVDQFKNTVPRYMSRHLIKSGMTGWAQVNGLRGNTSITERIKYDLYYIENWSLLFDVKIIIMTLFAIENAY